MQIPKFLNFLNKKQDRTSAQMELPLRETMGIMPGGPDDDEPENISNSTKIKVIAAFLIVGLAAYVAYWVQDPGETRADLLSGTEEVVSTEMVAETPVTQAEAVNTEAVSMETEQLAVPYEQMETVLPEQPTQQDLSTQEVSIIDFNYNPPEVKVPIGGTVVWTNMDAVPHTVSGLDFTSGSLNPGDSFTYTFPDEGTFDYACALHPQMKGKVVVGSGVSAFLNEQTQIIAPVENILPETQELIEPTAILPEVSSAFGMGGDQMGTPLITSADIQKAHASAAEQQGTLVSDEKISKSGPEDLVYVAAFGLILFLNRKKILSRSR